MFPEYYSIIFPFHNRQGGGTAVGTSTAEGGMRAVGIGKMIGPDGEEMDVLHVDIENLEGRTRKDEEIQVQ